jgi:hypothetical protein
MSRAIRWTLGAAAASVALLAAPATAGAHTPTDQPTDGPVVQENPADQPSAQATQESPIDQPSGRRHVLCIVTGEDHVILDPHHAGDEDAIALCTAISRDPARTRGGSPIVVLCPG